MEGSTFDRLTRAASTVGSRRRLLGVLASVGLGGLLTQLDDEAAEAKRKRHGRQRSHRPGKDKDNRKGKRKGNGGNGKGGGPGGGQCSATGNLCQQDSDCCTSNCFNFICAARETTCGTRQCVPPAKGCAGGSCCYGAAGCGDTCCELPANQCNPQDQCCVPNCTGRVCGPDGCGAGGTCGSCPSGQTCNETTGQCHGPSTCSAQSCPNGCCDAEGQCQAGDTIQACGASGGACQACPSGQVCLDGACRDAAGTCTGSLATCGENIHSPCNGSDSCTCDVSFDGATVCRSVNSACAACSSHADCGPSELCLACPACHGTDRACAAIC